MKTNTVQKKYDTKETFSTHVGENPYVLVSPCCDSFTVNSERKLKYLLRAISKYNDTQKKPEFI